jgi:hypothetical protein
MVEQKKEIGSTPKHLISEFMLPVFTDLIKISPIAEKLSLVAVKG